MAIGTTMVFRYLLWPETVWSLWEDGGRSDPLYLTISLLGHVVRASMVIVPIFGLALVWVPIVLYIGAPLGLALYAYVVAVAQFWRALN
jgi:hypothetical protein